MRLALLGYDDDAFLLARWAVAGGEHELVSAYGTDAEALTIRQLQPNVRLGDNWEELLVSSTADAVLVARGGQESARARGLDLRELRADQLRKLAQAAVPMIVVCPACEAIVGFEIEMIRSDVGGVIVPYLPGRHHPGLDELAAIIASGPSSLIGKVEQIVCERQQSDRSRGAVLAQLARDLALVRALSGDVQTVTASGPARDVGRDPLGPKSLEPPSLANLSVAFTTADRLPVRWSVSPPTTAEVARLTLVGERGKAVLTMPRTGDWSVDLAGDEYLTVSLAADPDLEPVFRRLANSIAPEHSLEEPTWLSACRDQEAAEAVDRSLARGRTIELFNEEHTEEASFKGVMAMGGCLILMGSLALVLLAAVVEGLHLPQRNWPLWRLWPYYLLVPLAVFLLLQLLGFALQSKETRVKPTLPVS